MLIAGCGSGSGSSFHAQSSRELALERAQFEQVSSQLSGLEAAVKREVAASRVAWPSIAGGLPQALGSGLRTAVSAANTRAKALPEPSFLANARKLTGPASGIAGIYENYEQLAQRGWNLTEAAVQTIASAGSSRDEHHSRGSKRRRTGKLRASQLAALHRRHLRRPFRPVLARQEPGERLRKARRSRSVRGSPDAGPGQRPGWGLFDPGGATRTASERERQERLALTFGRAADRGPSTHQPHRPF